jgi:hypothetical protein
VVFLSPRANAELIPKPYVALHASHAAWRRADYATPLYKQKLALSSLTSGSRSVGIVCGIVCSRTQATEFVCNRIHISYQCLEDYKCKRCKPHFVTHVSHNWTLWRICIWQHRRLHLLDIKQYSKAICVTSRGGL